MGSCKRHCLPVTNRSIYRHSKVGNSGQNVGVNQGEGLSDEREEEP